MPCLNPWDCESKRVYTMDGAICTLYAGMSSGGKHLAVLAPCACSPSTATSGRKGVPPPMSVAGGGFGLSETQVSYTLTATDRHIVGIIP